MQNKELLLAFRQKVYDRVAEIDPDGEKDWNDLACGFFLGTGASVEQATNYSLLCAANNGKLEIKDDN